MKVNVTYFYKKLYIALAVAQPLAKVPYSLLSIDFLKTGVP